MEALQVGLRSLSVPDQAASIPVFLLYPTHAAATPEQLGPYTLEVACDADPIQQELPLVVVSHGNSSSPWMMRDMIAYLVRAGFAVVTLEHPGNNHRDNSAFGTAANLVNRPRHLQLAIAAAYAQLPLSQRIAGIGHSIGAYSVLALAGGHPVALAHETEERAPRPLDVAHDPRIKALVLLAPATVWLGAPGGLTSVTAPIMLRAGDHDPHAPSLHYEIVRKGVPDPSRVDFELVANAGHFSFVTEVPASMRRPDFPPAQDPPGFERARYLPKLYEQTLAFLKQQLCAPLS